MSDSNALVPADVSEQNMSDNRNAIVPARKSSADVVEVESETVPNLASAFAQFQHAISNMAPDDINFEYEADRVRTRVRFRAYRHK
jgi:hypothetical protein